VYSKLTELCFLSSISFLYFVSRHAFLYVFGDLLAFEKLIRVFYSSSLW